nr:EcsC family protein [Paenibacillus sp. YYML68]
MLREVEAWEKEQKDLWLWERIGRLPFKLLDRLTPQSLQTKLAEALDEIGSYVQTGGQHLISDSSVLRRLKQELKDASPEYAPHAEKVKTASPEQAPHTDNLTHAPPEQAPHAEELTLERVKLLPLTVMNRAADSLARSRKTLATAQGATTGFGGLFTLAIDIPAILGLSLKTIQEIAMTYGYDPKLKEERVFVIKCLQFASADYVGKQAVLQELSVYGQAHEHAEQRREALSQLQGWREVITAYRDNFGWKKLFQLVPIAGMLLGAILNRSTLHDVAEAATMLYRKRRILERLHAQTET